MPFENIVGKGGNAVMDLYGHVKLKTDTGKTNNCLNIEMLSLYASNGSMVEDKTRKLWIDYIVKDSKDLNIKGAAMIYENGNKAACTKNFTISSEDFRNFYRAYTDPAVDRVAFRGVTYCIKSRDSEQMVCFNGNKYMIMNRTQKMFILTHCVSKQKSVLVAEWINSVAKKLKERRT